MASLLEDIIKERIRKNGPMGVGAFMSLALGHPEHGYYINRDPLGRGGDFITAPEVSQLFGEMIGVWVADVWMQMGRPERFILLECGPGRGTLMADMLRATQNVAGFYDAAQICFLEMSPVLCEAQRGALEGREIQWFECLEDVSNDAPMIVVGNEFLDALPFQQFVGDCERVVALSGDALVFVPEEGDIFERSAERERFAADVCGRLKAQGGAALFIDYGHVRSGAGDTFQAVKGHEYVDVFSHIGDADLTSHVDFEALGRAVEASVFGPVTQGAFLKALGIELRLEALRQKAGEQQAEMLEKGLHRLVDSAQMGELFKVIGFTHDKNIIPAGF